MGREADEAESVVGEEARIEDRVGGARHHGEEVVGEPGLPRHQGRMRR